MPSGLLQAHTVRRADHADNAARDAPLLSFSLVQPMFGLAISFISYPVAVWWLRRLFENMGLETNTKFLIFLLASVVSWVAGTAASHL